MMPMLPFVAGLIAGAAAVTALRGERVRAMVDDAGAHLRGAMDQAESAARSGLVLLQRVTPGRGAPPTAGDGGDTHATVTAGNPSGTGETASATASPARTRRRAADQTTGTAGTGVAERAPRRRRARPTGAPAQEPEA
jgi:hypothetical protein